MSDKAGIRDLTERFHMLTIMAFRSLHEINDKAIQERISKVIISAIDDLIDIGAIDGDQYAHLNEDAEALAREIIERRN